VRRGVERLQHRAATACHLHFDLPVVNACTPAYIESSNDGQSCLFGLLYKYRG
jgi:hypothetical protein